MQNAHAKQFIALGIIGGTQTKNDGATSIVYCSLPPLGVYFSQGLLTHARSQHILALHDQHYLHYRLPLPCCPA